MRLGILGTGIVAQTLAGKLAALGHEVQAGTRDVSATLARSDPAPTGAPPFAAWRAEHPAVRLGTFAEAAAHGQALINATGGTS